MDKDRRHFQYQILANEIAEKITKGIFKINEKLPSTRELHKKLNLSINTIYKAYIELERRGLIEAKPKSGFYIKNQLSPAGYRKNLNDSKNHESFKIDSSDEDSSSPFFIKIPSFVNEVLKTSNDPDYTQFGTAMISPDFLPFKQLSQISREITSASMRSILSYSIPQGDLELRRQLSIRSLGILNKINADDFIITNGCAEALAICIQSLTKPGDIIAIESPAYFGVLPLLEELRLKVVEIETDPSTGIEISSLEKLLKKGNIATCLLSPNFQNPTGALMSETKKQDLMKMLGRFNLPIIEDNINSELYYGKDRPLPLKAYDKNDQVILCSSVSKTLAPGLRIGWIIPGGRFFEKILKTKVSFSVATSSLDQLLLRSFMEQGNYERYLRGLRDKMEQQVENFCEAINLYFPDDTSFSKPKGGILLWLKCSSSMDSLQIYQKALEKKVSIIPGYIFSTSGRFKNYIRLGCGFPFDEEAEKGLAILGSIIKDNR